MHKNALSLAKLWSLLRDQEKKLGLDKLSLTERDIFLCILFLQEKNKLISLENIIKNCIDSIDKRSGKIKISLKMLKSLLIDIYLTFPKRSSLFKKYFSNSSCILVNISTAN